MTEPEYDKLVSQFGEQFTLACIEELDNYKGAKGRTYKSDYRAILSWVVDRVREKRPGLEKASKETVQTAPQEEFDTVQQLMTSRRREQNAGGFKNIFAGVIKCADCGYALRAMNANRRKRPDVIDCVLYSCNNYARYGRSECTPHNIEARDLFNAVLDRGHGDVDDVIDAYEDDTGY